MAELIADLQEIKQRGAGVHLLCPKHSNDDESHYDIEEVIAENEEVVNIGRAARIKEAQARRKKFTSVLQLLAYDGQESEVYKNYIWEQLNDALSSCDLCIRHYYIGKLSLLKDLREEYDENDIKDFLAIIDRQDIQRIIRGLAVATETLRNLPAKQRSMSGLPPGPLHAVFESLICEAFFKNQELLRDHLDEPLKLIQTKKPLRIREYLPAATQFMFEANEERLKWANNMWDHIQREPTDLEWDWTMKDVLQTQLQNSASPNAITRLWTALPTIVTSLSEKQITHKLFDLVPNIGTTALNHLAKQSPAVPFIIRTMTIILTKAPEAFWQSMGSISSSTVAEQIFASPYFNKILQEETTKQNVNPLDIDLLSWVAPFLLSLKPANRHPACHTLAVQLFERVQNTMLPNSTRRACYEVAMKVILQTLLSFSDNEKARLSVDRVVLSDILNTVSQRITQLLRPPGFGSFGDRAAQIQADVLSIVRNSLALECQCLKTDFEALSTASDAQREMSSYSPGIWNAVIQNLKDDDVKLSKAALLGIMALPGLEEFRTRDPERLSKGKQSYNSIFEKIVGMQGRMLERLAGFGTEHLQELLKAQDTSMSLVAALFSADQNTYQCAIELIKNLTGQSGRREAMSHLLDSFLGTTVYGLSWVMRRISNLKTFASIPRMLKNGLDILDVLCSQQDGILREKSITNRDAQAIQSYWSYQWIALKTIFAQMEPWSQQVHDKPRMTEVCRDAMQYAEALFEQFELFASALVLARPDHKDEIPKALLDSSESSNGSPLKALDKMSRWLRLRDEYLADTIVKLIAKMLNRLQARGVLMAIDGLTYVEEVAVGNSVRTMLSESQKAVLVRALESYFGKHITRERPKVKKQSTLKGWTEVGTPHSTGASTPVSQDYSADEFDDPSIDDKDWEIVSENTVGLQNDQLAKRAELGKRKAPLIRPDLLKPRPGFNKGASAAARKALETKAFIEERKKQIAAGKLRKVEEAARLRGKVGIGEQTKGQGSGLSSIGIKGKDHSLGHNSMMVSSSSESDSDDEDEQLFGSKVQTLQHVQRGALPAPRIAPTKKIKQQRSHKDIRARLAPDLSTLHKAILSWDFFADSDVPPSSDRTDYTLVSNTFKTVEDYQRTFEPLLVLEGWQSFRSAREEGNFKPFEIKVSNSLIVDSFVEINTVMPLPARREDRPAVNVADVVLFSKSKKPETDASEPHCLARVKEVSIKKGELSIVYRVASANNPLRPSLNDKSVIYGVSLLSLTPLEREYGALMALPFYDLCEEVIRAKPSPLPPYSEQELQQFMRTYDVNQAQAKAVRSAIDNDAFTLIQGPPGSGKTKTICAIVGSMMTGFLTSSSTATGRLNALPPPRSSKKILVCAPSNAAVDELVMRFKSGIKLMNGAEENLSIVRLGRSEAINANVKDVTLEELVNAKLSASGPQEKEDINAVMKDHKATCEEFNALRDKISEIRGKGQPVKPEDENTLDGLGRKKRVLGSRIDDMRERQNTASRDAELHRKRIQQQILDSAHVLCATLSGSGHEIFQGLNVEFETVIIDEAAQSIELSALIPLKYGCSKCILVGDPKQLPPTVLSREAAKFQYEQSLFARMERNHATDVHLLDTQYRMHPEISLFPSKTFYDSRLKDGTGMAQLRKRPWHNATLFSPYRFFDVQGMSQSAPKGHSLVNFAELEVAMRLYERLVTDVKRYDFSRKIGVITPYKGQLKALKQRFRAAYGEEILTRVEFNTTDAFQGRESEIIIFSCVRASTKGIGFLQDIRRMNVGLTRAKSSLWVLGNSASLVQGEFWRALVSDAKSRNLYTEGDVLRMLERPLLTEDMMKDDVEMEDADAPTPTTSRGGSVPKPEVAKSATPSNAHSSESSVPKQDSKTSGQLSTGRTKLVAKSSSPVSVSDSSESGSSRLNTSKSGPPSSRSGSSAAPMRQPSAENTSTGKVATVTLGTEKGADRPSGGRYGLRDIDVCNICGSDAHFSHKCDNIKAKEASLGNCFRCKQPGHGQMSCNAPRCLQCGEIGHKSDACLMRMDRRLSAKDREDVKRQELAFQNKKELAREKRAEKQLGEHGRKIPEVKSSLPLHDSANGEGKRKREDTSSIDAPDGPKAMRLSKDSEKGGEKSLQSPSRPPTLAQGPNRHPQAGGTNGLPPRPPGKIAPPMLKRRKPAEADLFMKRK